MCVSNVLHKFKRKEKKRNMHIPIVHFFWTERIVHISWVDELVICVHEHEHVQEIN